MRRGVRSGEMDQRITIKSVSTSNNTVTNQAIESYSTLVANLPAKRLGPVSKEQFEANQQVAHGVVRYMIRRRTDVTERMRIIEGSLTYEISGIEDFGRMGYMILTAEKRDNG
jgi:SPP1 family predicted phage head-tail adaptor